jgi:4-amino-4-deoxy-L-arabinose transferase-like glycosyltransferase
MTTTSVPAQRPELASRAIAALSVLAFALHVVVDWLSPYGFQRDEFLYMAMGRHLQLWRMDFPPFIAMLSQVQRFLFGDSMVAIRFSSALAAGALVVLAALIARELGGGKISQLLAALAVACSPVFIRTGVLFQPVVFDEMWWTLALYALAKIGAESPNEDWRPTSPPWWIALGAACGLGLLTKFSLLFFGAALVAALVLAPQRRVLLTRWPWIAAVIALVLGSPSIVGQLRLGFPVVEQMHTLEHSQLRHVSFLSFVAGQLFIGPAVLLAVAGAAYVLNAPSMRRFRVIGLTCVGAFVLLLVLHGKSYYISPIYPALFAAGAVALERWSKSMTVPWRVSLRAAVALLFIAGALAMLPLELPIFSKEYTARFVERSGLAPAARTNQGMQLRLPQDYADMLGWPEEVAAVAHVYDSLPAEKHAQTVLGADNYGEAGALEFYGPHYKLPNVISGTGSYWFFGPGDKPGTVLIVLGGDKSDLDKFYGTVTEVSRVRNEWGVPEEMDVPIYVAEQPRSTLQKIWPLLAGQD